MTGSAVALDLFDFAGSTQLPNDVACGLERLVTCPPLWPIDAARWAVVLDRVTAFADRWDAQARACGWSDVQLYGVHRRAPYANLAAMGAAWVLARAGHRAVGVTDEAVQLVSATGAGLRLFHMPADANAVLPWDVR